MGYLVRLKTTKSVTIQKLFEILQGLFSEVNFVFYPKTEDNPGGLIIKEMNKYRTLLGYLNLSSDNFEVFEYNANNKNGEGSEYFHIGVNLKYLSKFLKCMVSYDSLTIAIDKDDLNSLLITLENQDDKKEISLNVVDLKYKPFKVASIDASYMNTMSSANLNKYFKDLLVVSKKVNITCNGKKFILKGNGEIGNISFTIKPGDNNLKIIRDESEKEDIIVQGSFELTYLIIITKCCSFSENVTIYIKNDYPLILEYNVEGLGFIKFVVSRNKSNESYDLY